VRQDVTNLYCPNGTANAPCGGNPSQPFVSTVIRVCHTGGAGQMTNCPGSNLAVMTGPNGCAVCENINLICM
jgi:hypothetical protein